MKFSRFFVNLFLLVSLTIGFTACIDSDPGQSYDPYAQLETDLATIDSYLTTAGVSSVIKDPRGIRMVLNGPPANGLTALGTNRVKVNYTGRVLGSQTPFESSTVTGQELRSYISGWQIALSILPVGSSATVYIPSPLAYGNVEKGTIPANSILVFDMTFIDIEETETEKSRLVTDTTAIYNYLKDKPLTTLKDASGLRYMITTEGSGPTPGLYDQMKAKFVYKLLTNDGAVILNQTLEPTENFYNRVVDHINGLQIGLQKMKIGGKATFYIPSGLAYGPYPVTNGGATIMPANSNLIVEVELLEIL